VIIESIGSGEGTDRADLKLNQKTASFIRKLAKDKGKGRICLILNVPGPVELDGIEDLADSIFTVYYPGMMGAKAMADIMTGTVNPSGALTCTFPVSYKDTPAYLCYPDSLTCTYGEGIYAGYRGYMKRGIRPLYPFGYGLSYSKFAVKDISAERRGDKISVACSVSNTSKIDGKAVVQLYVSKKEPVAPRAPVELKGFSKVLVKAGAAAKVTLSFDKSELAYFDENYGKFLLEEGAYDLFLSLQGVEKLIPAGSIRIDDGSEELKCGVLWEIGRIAKNRDLTDALRKDAEELGVPFAMFSSAVRYVPFMKLADLLQGKVNLRNFNQAAGRYRAV
jgi:beta-glucosidase